jgi:hypothetical protein
LSCFALVLVRSNAAPTTIVPAAAPAMMGNLRRLVVVGGQPRGVWIAVP